MWPVTVLVTSSVGLVTLAFNPSVWVLIPLALIVGGGAPFLRIAIWKRRHPLVSTNEYVQRQRDNAWLN